MRYKIIYDKPGRLRLRMGHYAFDAEQGYGIEELLLSQPGVLTAEATSINGGLLICYKENCRRDILDIISGLRKDNLPKSAQKDENIIKELDNKFFGSLFRLLGKHYAMRFLLPTPVRIFFTLKRALPYWMKGISALAHGKLNVDVLDAAAVGASIFQRDFTTASSIMTLLSITGLLEDYTRKRAMQTLSQSLVMNVDKVWRLEGAEENLTPLSQIQIGDLIRLRSGWVIPLDGDVYSGEAMVNEASMTGEPMAVLRKSGHSVYAGTVVEEGSMMVRVRTLADNTRIQQIVDMIDHSEALKAGIQCKAERLADSIVPFSFLAFGATLAFTGNLAKAMSVLMVDYSCAIKLTTPICIITAIRESANKRILIKGGKHLEAFAMSNVLIFDKTGTLTAACPNVAKVIPADGRNRDDVLRVSACLEEHFPHSVAKAIVRQAEEENLQHREEHADVEYVVAHGISSTLGGERVLIGSKHFIFEDENIPWPAKEGLMMETEAEGYTAVYLAIGGKWAGMICVEDPVRKDAKYVLDALKTMGFSRIVMLTGDGDLAAKSVCETLGINEYRSGMLPEEKAAFVRECKENGDIVIMVGDGINDSPALSLADVSVAMKDGSDIAKEVADITLLDDNLDGLITMRLMSRDLLTRIQRNYHLILGFNTSLLVLGLAGVISASTSALMHNVSTMALCGASMRPFNPGLRAKKKAAKHGSD